MIRLSLLLFAGCGLATAAQCQSRSYPPKIDDAREERYKSVDGVELKLWVFEPAGHRASDRRPAVVFFFGGGWKGGSPGQFAQHCRYLASRGMVAMTADYRVRSRHGTLADRCVADAKSAVRWIRRNADRLGVDPRRIVAGGGSAGGHLAACTAVVPDLDDPHEDGNISSAPNALALFNPALVLARHDGVELDEAKLSDLQTRTGVEPERISPIHHVRPGLPPAIIFHGREDVTVPYATADAFARAYRAAGNRCELHGYRGAGHGFFNYGRGGQPGEHYTRTVEALDRFLGSLGYLQGEPTVRDSEPGNDDAASNVAPQAALVLSPGPGNPRNSEGDFIRLADGRIRFIYTRFSGGSGDHDAATLVSRESSDGGRTWSAEDVEVIGREGDMNVMSVSLLRLRDGRVGLFYLRKDSPTDCRPLMRLSSDDAETWSEPVQIVPDNQTGYYIVNNDRVIQLHSGRLVVPVALHHRPGWDAPDWKGQVGCYLSDDGGESWRRSQTMQRATGPDGHRVTVQEPGVVELRDGRLLMWVRTDAGEQYRSYSGDGGETWSPLEPMGIASPRSPASIERIEVTGDLLMVWNDHLHLPLDRRTARTPLSVAVSHDEGLSWSPPKVLEADPQGWYCYTAIECLDDEVLLGYAAGDQQPGRRLATTKVVRVPLTWLPTVADRRAPIVVGQQALRLHRSGPVIDGHNDLPWAIRDSGRALETFDLKQPQPDFHTDIGRLRQGGVGAQFWSVYVPVSTRAENRALSTTLQQIDLVKRMVAQYDDVFELALGYRDIERIRREGKIASMIGVEGGHSIENSLSVLRQLYREGARYMTLTHSETLDWADSCTDEPRHGGLAPFGEEVVREMNRLGMLVDISHVSADCMRDVLQVTEAPVIFSHSSARTVAEHPRNVPDDVLRKTAENGGVVMINFYNSFVEPIEARRSLERSRLRESLRQRYPDDRDRVREELRQWEVAHPRVDRCSVHHVLDHIEHVIRVAGIDHVGLGSDYDGVPAVPRQLEDVASYPAITQGLLDRGYSEAGIRKVLGENLLRVFREAEAVASELSEDSPQSSSRSPAIR